MSDDTLRRLSASLADRYRIEHELGAGGMATVYLARDLRHQRDVAVKVMRPEVSADLASERFLLEIGSKGSVEQGVRVLVPKTGGSSKGSEFLSSKWVRARGQSSCPENGSRTPTL